MTRASGSSYTAMGAEGKPQPPVKRPSVLDGSRVNNGEGRDQGLGCDTSAAVSCHSGAPTSLSPPAVLREIAYLHDEARRLGAPQAARLLAAAALSFCEEVPEAMGAASEAPETRTERAPGAPE